MKKIKIISILSFFIMSSCSNTVFSDWSSCRNTDSKLGCVSITQADKATQEKNNYRAEIAKKIPNISRNAQDIDLSSNLTRKPDIVGRLWIAPYLDGNGYYHEGSFVRVIDESSKWEFRK